MRLILLAATLCLADAGPLAPQLLIPPQNPCQPSPCGPNSVCRITDGQAVCSCQPNYLGSPPSCRPECVVSYECPQNQACIRQKCQDPCPGTCGVEAQCQVVNHNPICSCPPRFTGDPFVQCFKEVISPQNSCYPSPCGPNSVCRITDGQAVCSCQPSYLGSPPSCRPECVVSSECPQNRACINQKCQDPCPGTCGVEAQCQVVNHSPICSCPPRFTGDPFVQCIKEEITPQNPCQPSPCGPNSVCRITNGHAVCSCQPNYLESPPSCRPECVVSSECPQNRACINQKCQDPCPGTCGVEAQCQIVNHNPICSCPPRFTGDPFVQCFKEAIPPQNPCQPSPCGPNSGCRIVNGHAICSCQPNFVGSPPSCRPECVVSSECPQNQACVRQKCQDPCPGTCGVEAQCQIVNHSPICSCPPHFTGDPFFECIEEDASNSVL